jgi:hypothetical protein
LLEGHFGLDPEETSRVTLILLLGKEAGPTVRFGIGLSGIPGQIASRLTDFRPGQRVVGVWPDGRGVDLASGDRLEAEGIVLAVPAPEVQKLLPGLSPLEELFFRSCRYVPRNVVIVPGAPEPRAPRVHWIPGRDGGRLAAIFRIPAYAQEPKAPGYTLLVARPSAATRDPERLAHDLCSGASRFDPSFPHSTNNLPLRTVSRFSPRFDVGRYQALARIRPEWYRHRARRRVVFCGGYLVAPHAEGAAISGLRAARELLERIRGVELTH